MLFSLRTESKNRPSHALADIWGMEIQSQHPEISAEADAAQTHLEAVPSKQLIKTNGLMQMIAENMASDMKIWEKLIQEKSSQGVPAAVNSVQMKYTYPMAIARVSNGNGKKIPPMTLSRAVILMRKVRVMIVIKLHFVREGRAINSRKATR